MEVQQEKKKVQVFSIVLILACMATLSFSRPVLDNFNIPKFPFITTAGITSLLFSLYFLRYETPMKRRNIITVISPFLFFLVAFVISMLFGPAGLAKGFFGSQGRLNGFATYASFALISIFLIVSFSKKHSVFFVALFALCTFIQISYSILQFLDRDFVNWDFSNIGEKTILGTLGNPNFVASFLAVSSIYFLIHSLDRGSRVKFRILAFVLTFTGAFMTYETGSLQGPLLLIIGLLTLVYLRAAFKFRQKRSFFIISTPVIFLSVLVLTLGLLGKVDQLNFLKIDTFIFRFEYAKIGIKMFIDNWLFGAGIDSFGENFRRYRSEESFLIIPFNIDNPHNGFIALAANAGLFVLLSQFSILILVIMKVIQHFRVASKVSTFMIANLVALVLLQAQSLISIDNIGLAAWSWIFTGCILGEIEYLRFQEESVRDKVKMASRASVQDRDPAFLARSVAWSLVLLAAIFSWQVVERNKDLKSLQVYSSTNPTTPSPQFNIDFVKELYRFYDYDSAYSRLLSSYAFNIGLEEVGEEISASTAIRHKKSYEVLNQRATILEVTQRSELATPLRRSALEVEPNLEESYVALASNLLSVGQRIEAIKVLNVGLVRSFNVTNIKFYLDSILRQWSVGDKVFHNNYGNGEVVSIDKGKISVKFYNEGVGIKTFKLDSAPLAFSK